MEPPPLPPSGQASPVLLRASAGPGAGVVLAWVFGGVFGLIVLVALAIALMVPIWNAARGERVVLGLEVGEGIEGVGEVMVEVNGGGDFVLGERELGEDELLGKLGELAGRDGDLRVRIRADHEASYSDVTKVLDICQKLGIWNVAFSTLPPEGADMRRDTR